MGDQVLEDHFQHLLERGLEGEDTEEYRDHGKE